MFCFNKAFCNKLLSKISKSADLWKYSVELAI